MLPFHDPAVAFLVLVPQPHRLTLALGDPGHLGLDKLNAHGLGVLVKLFVPLAKGADIHVVDGDIGQGQGPGQEHGLLDRVHAADP